MQCFVTTLKKREFCNLSVLNQEYPITWPRLGSQTGALTRSSPLEVDKTSNIYRVLFAVLVSILSDERIRDELIMRIRNT